MTQRIAEQTATYEKAGADHADAACLANITARIQPPVGSKVVIGTEAQSRAIDRCHISERTLERIGARVGARLRDAN